MAAFVATRRSALRKAWSALALLPVLSFGTMPQRAKANAIAKEAPSGTIVDRSIVPDSRVEDTSMALKRLIVDHIVVHAKLLDASRETDAIAIGGDPSFADLQRLDDLSRTERDLFIQLCRHPMRTISDHRQKASYLLGFRDCDEFEHEHIVALLESMTVDDGQLTGAGQSS